MAKYLDTSQISSELMQLLKEAKEKIILVTYSLQVNTQIQERLKTKSKIGTLSEITIIYGNTNLKEKELKWMEEIEDLKIFQKKNLHAKCYINENKAIISSMNLYDYSQSTNIEMGLLIDKKTDAEAYEKMMEDINHLKVNADRKRINELEETPKEKAEKAAVKLNVERELFSPLSYRQQIKKFLLEEYRQEKSHDLRQKSHTILSDNIIDEIISVEELSSYQLSRILKSKKKMDELGSEILNLNDFASNFYLGIIEDTRYQNDSFSYDQIKMRGLSESQAAWYDTKQELPKKGQIVAVLLNKNWFNQYLILEKTDKEDRIIHSSPKDYSSSQYRTTKELAQILNISSREVNSILVDSRLMSKDGDDWSATPKGERFGAQQKEGKFGKFLVWPEEN